jgi:hypothetical protein
VEFDHLPSPGSDAAPPTDKRGFRKQGRFDGNRIEPSHASGVIDLFEEDARFGWVTGVIGHGANKKRMRLSRQTQNENRLAWIDSRLRWVAHEELSAAWRAKRVGQGAWLRRFGRACRHSKDGALYASQRDGSVHVDENLAEATIGIISCSGVDLLTANARLLGVAVAPVGEAFALRKPGDRGGGRPLPVRSLIFMGVALSGK